MWLAFINSISLAVEYDLAILIGKPNTLSYTKKLTRPKLLILQKLQCKFASPSNHT